MFFPPPGCATDYIAYRSVRNMDFARATITRDIFIPGPTQCGLSRSLTNRQNTEHFTSLKREFALPSTWSWLPSRLSPTWRRKERIECIFSNSKYAKKAGHFKWKAGKRDGAKKAWVYARKRYCWHLWRKGIFRWGKTVPRHATISWWKSVFFPWKPVSIRILHLCIDVEWKRSRDSYRDAVYKKISTLCNKNRQSATKNQNRSFTSRGATVGLGLRLWLTRSIVLHGGTKYPVFFGNLAEKGSCVDGKTANIPY